MSNFTKSTADNGAEKVLPKAGLTQCVVTGLIMLGTKTETYKDGTSKDVFKLGLEMKLPTQHHIFDEEIGPEPLMLYRDVTFSLHPKATLNTIVTNMLGKSLPGEFDILEILGLNCMVNIVHVVKGDNTYANAASFSPLMDGVDAVELPTRSFDIYSPDLEILALLPEWKQEQIKATKEFRAASSADKEATKLPEGM